MGVDRTGWAAGAVVVLSLWSGVALGNVAVSKGEDEAVLQEEAVQSGVMSFVEKAAGLTPRQKREVALAIVKEAKANGLDPLLVVAVIRAESSFNNYAVSNVGALGLMQVMPDTGKWLAEKRQIPFAHKRELFDPQLNISLGTSYLADLIKRFGSVERALVAYNAGPGAAKKILADDTRRVAFLAGYPKKIVTDFARLKAKRDAAAKLTATGASSATGGR